MNDKKVFCAECRNDVNYTIKNLQIKGTLKGETYTYFGKMAYCANCNSEIYVEEVNDHNLKALYDKYREVHGIASLDMILKNF